MKTTEEILDKVLVGDVLDVLSTFPDGIVDITVTSPPYNKRNSSQGWLVNHEKYTHSDDQMPEKEYRDWQVIVLNELYRVTKPGGSLFYNHKIRWEGGHLLHPFAWVARSRWHLRQEIIWDRTLAANVRGWRFWQVDERVYWLYKPVDQRFVGPELQAKHAKMGSIWRLKPVPRTDSHPAPFPIELPLRAIYSMPGTGERIVMDPFCGTGTTLVAAKILGHHYIGIDVSPVYAKCSEDRLTSWASEKAQAEEELARHRVTDPFEDRKKRGTVSWPFGPQPKHENGDPLPLEAIEAEGTDGTQARSVGSERSAGEDPG
jgi:modification methylase